jgi:hypothetical protein
MKKHLAATGILGILALPLLYYSFLEPFPRESGDNIVHYYFAHEALKNPVLFLDLWAKPVFTFLSSPFSIFGFGGMILFNGMMGLASGWIVYLISRKLGFKFPWLAILFVFFAPTYFTLLFSGYTEPLFGLFLVTGLYLAMKERYHWAAFLISLIPFIRTEGVLIIVIFGLYFFLKKKWIPVITLISGPLLMAVAGFLSGKSLFWIFTEIPYAVTSDYGSGTLTHYAEQWVLAVGVPLTISSIAGLILLAYGLFKKKVFSASPYKIELYLLLPALFMGYFLFHSLSWRFGLFTSYGLIRILVPLIPLQGIISLLAIQYLLKLEIIHKKFKHILLTLFIIYLFVFPFLNNPASINWERDFRQRTELLRMQELSKEVESQYPGKFLYYSEPYFSYAFNINHFDHSLHLNFTELPLSAIKPNSIIIWDSWTSCNYARFVYNFDTIAGFRLLRTYPDPATGEKANFKVYSKD